MLKVRPERIETLERDLVYVSKRLRQIETGVDPNYTVDSSDYLTPRLQGVEVPLENPQGVYVHYLEVARVLGSARDGSLSLEQMRLGEIDLSSEFPSSPKAKSVRPLISWPDYISEIIKENLGRKTQEFRDRK